MAKIHKFDFGWGSTPDPAGGSSGTALPRSTPSLDLKGPTSKGKDDRSWEGDGREGEGETWERGREGEPGGERREG